MKLILFATLAALVSISAGQDCDVITDLIADGTNDEGSGAPCSVNPCDPDTTFVTGNDTCPSHCFTATTGACLMKTILLTKLEAKYSNTSDDDITGRYYTGGGSPIYPYPNPPAYHYPPIAPICPKKFPENCIIANDYHSLQKLLEPPVDIPYCQRIPCHKGNPYLEKDRLACHSQPGCYFDVQLGLVRKAVGHSILPGVPVCHRAIRNAAFHKLVGKYLKGGKKWNGVYTKCFIKQNYEEIYNHPPAGCYVANVLQYIGVKPKRAGWKGISPRECSLIGGCLKAGVGCYYPSDLSKIQVRSGSDVHRKSTPSGRDIYGQPMCLPFNPLASPRHYLEEYHYCLQSGCVMDSSFGHKKLRDALYNITVTFVKEGFRHKFWDLVCQGKVRPDNWQKVIRGLYNTPIYQSPFPYSLNISQPQGRGASFGGGIGQFLGYGPNPPPYCPGDPYYPKYPQYPQQAPLPYQPQPLSYQQPQYPPQQPQYPPQQPQYPPQQPQYPPQVPQYPPQVPQYPFPPQRPQYPPFFPFPPQGPICPYKNHNLRGYFKLKGSFKGCCEKNLCYIPRLSLYDQHSGVASYLSNWEAWGKCSKSCAGGLRSRKRECIRYKSGDNCESNLDYKQTETCNTKACPYYGSWESWSSCTASCGGGTKERRRACYPAGKGCGGKATESYSCNTKPCPHLTQWTEWGDCSKTCGKGYSSRTRECNSYSGSAACDNNINPLYENKECMLHTGTIKVASTGNCQTSFYSCTKVVKYKCVCPDGYTEGKCLNFAAEKTVNCYGEPGCQSFGK